MTVLALALAHGAYAQTACVLNNACPGPTSIQVEGLTPSGTYKIIRGNGLGAGTVSSGPCAGVVTSLAIVNDSGSNTANTDGTGIVNFEPGTGACTSGLMQILDQSTCTLSPVVDLVADACGGAGALVGSFLVNSGPSWSSDPPTKSCMDQCAVLFGGLPMDYQCSTNGATINHNAYEDGWGDSSYCSGTGVPESWKKSVTYDCGAGKCSYSAWVVDHGCASTNYCYTR